MSEDIEYVYMLLNGNEWDDVVLYLTKDQAISQSILYPNYRVEIFKKTSTCSFLPTYYYYKNGKIFMENASDADTE